ncbi:hypothetical protein NPX13_g1783 [Xylaria arbuscula]|uniref:SprT-like domain-containing protein n=1 Tax=Xylaria arbuscula TaxID=114810 RepID=A0A9W8TPB7_9PEZI|nr:hypothetical protein NPX13_g1783 [Xylaria arbuscula]
MSSSEDDFPDVEVIAQRRKEKTTFTKFDSDEEEASRQTGCPKSTHLNTDVAAGKTPATTRRRRKLGQSQQSVGNTLLKPWEDKGVEKGAESRVARSRQTSTKLACEKEEETSFSSTTRVMGRLPAKTKKVESRVVTSSTVFDNSPEEPKKTRRLISRGEKKALELRVVQKELDSLLSSDGPESDAASCSQDDDSDFIVRGDSESEESSPPSPRRSQSPSGPRRLQRRVLSSSREPAWMKPRVDEPRTLSGGQQERRNITKKPATRKVKPAPKGDLEDFFKELKISYDESESEEPARGTSQTPQLDPVTPKKKITASPDKVPRIPMSPWKPEHKEFWDPEVNFAWIDKHSPPKKSPKKVLDLTAPDSKEVLKRKYGTSPEKKQAKKAFDAVKEELARDFLLELDEVITDGKLGQLTEATGGLRIVWSNTLLTTAGRAHWKCKTTTTTSKKPSSALNTANATSTSTITKSTTAQHYAHIELAVKVLSNESDLLNTVAHEFCHLAVFILHGKPKQAHGAEFKAYGQRVMRASSSPSCSTTKKTTSTSTSTSTNANSNNSRSDMKH